MCPKGGVWDERTKEEYADKVFSLIDQYAPGFKQSILYKDILAPPDLERVFGLTGVPSHLPSTNPIARPPTPPHFFVSQVAISSMGP